jgi:hypothetical protein
MYLMLNSNKSIIVENYIDVQIRGTTCGLEQVLQKGAGTALATEGKPLTIYLREVNP